MKTLSFRLLFLCVSILSVAHSEAAPSSKKTFGGFKTGSKFTFIVQKVTSSRSNKTTVTPKAPIPEGIPKFKVGQKITFKIGKKGELNGPGFSISMINSTSSVNLYSKQPTSKTVSPNGASVFKDAKGKPVVATMAFYLYRAPNFTAKSLSINRVGYVLKYIPPRK